jgi:hypothetical protein
MDVWMKTWCMDVKNPHLYGWMDKNMVHGCKNSTCGWMDG